MKAIFEDAFKKRVHRAHHYRSCFIKRTYCLPPGSSLSNLTEILAPDDVSHQEVHSLIEEELVEPSSTSKPLALAALFGVALLWGSYTPALRFLFLTDEPPSAALMNALQACLPTPFLAASGVIAYLNRHSRTDVGVPSSQEAVALLRKGILTVSLDLDDEDKPVGVITESISVRHSLSGEFQTLAQQADDIPAKGLLDNLKQSSAYLLNWRSESLLVAGAELGLWMFLDFGLEVSGVQLISATKAAFLNQATVLITPVLMYLAGDLVKTQDWAACCLALLGSILVASDGLSSDMGTEGIRYVGQDNALGYFYTLLSAVFFAMSTVRMGRYSTQFNSLNLASTAAFSLAFFSLCWVAVSVQGQPEGYLEIFDVMGSLALDPSSLAVLLWCAVGPGALAAFLQAVGQQSVPPAQAQVIYALTPLFSAGLAMLVLDASDEAMGPIAWVGASFMLGASLVASVGSSAAAE